jgi:putative addiction module component (TIGR02574 family)
MSAHLEIPPEFDVLSSDDKVAFVQKLWDRIAENPQQVQIPDEHERMLERRLAAYAANPRAGQPWNEVRDELLAKLRS